MEFFRVYLHSQHFDLFKLGHIILLVYFAVYYTHTLSLLMADIISNTDANFVLQIELELLK